MSSLWQDLINGQEARAQQVMQPKQASIRPASWWEKLNDTVTTPGGVQDPLAKILAMLEGQTGAPQSTGSGRPILGGTLPIGEAPTEGPIAESMKMGNRFLPWGDKVGKAKMGPALGNPSGAVNAQSLTPLDKAIQPSLWDTIMDSVTGQRGINVPPDVDPIMNMAHGKPPNMALNDVGMGGQVEGRSLRKTSMMGGGEAPKPPMKPPVGNVASPVEKASAGRLKGFVGRNKGSLALGGAGAAVLGGINGYKMLNGDGAQSPELNASQGRVGGSRGTPAPMPSNDKQFSLEALASQLAPQSQGQDSMPQQSNPLMQAINPNQANAQSGKFDWNQLTQFLPAIIMAIAMARGRR